LAFFDTCPGGKTYSSSLTHCHRARQSNPYLRWPVIFDEYTKNRDVWRCPSAKIEGGANGIIGYTDWFGYMVANEGSWGTGETLAPCGVIWPRGWGGDVTDTLQQDRTAVGANKAFVQSIGNMYYPGLKLVEVEDPVNFVVLGDAGVTVDDFSCSTLAYPDICCLGCSGTCGWADWVICTWAQDCGLYEIAPNDGSFLTNPELRKPYARHLGGVNVGFLDGHAAWYHSDTIITKVRDGDWPGPGPWAPTSEDDSWVSSCFPDAVYIW
jgi:prepilin-type processing-associated H-X9-DG protein